MTKYIITPEAESDIRSIWSFIAADNLVSADKVLNFFYDAIDTICAFPDIGVIKNILTDKNLRFYKVYNYFIVYDHKERPIKILRVLSAYRDIKNIL